MSQQQRQRHEVYTFRKAAQRARDTYKLFVNCDELDLTYTNIKQVVKADYQSKSAIIDGLNDLGYPDNNFIIKMTIHSDRYHSVIVKHEYNIALALQNIPGFARYICVTQCYDDNKNYDGLKDRTTICNGDRTNPPQLKNLLIMPYFPLGSIKKFD